MFYNNRAHVIPHYKTPQNITEWYCNVSSDTSHRSCVLVFRFLTKALLTGIFIAIRERHLNWIRFNSKISYTQGCWEKIWIHGGNHAGLLISPLFKLSLYYVTTTKLWDRGITLFFLLSSNLLLQGGILKNYDIEALAYLRFLRQKVWTDYSGITHLLTLENKNPGSVTKKLSNPSKSKSYKWNILFGGKRKFKKKRRRKRVSPTGAPSERWNKKI